MRSLKPLILIGVLTLGAVAGCLGDGPAGGQSAVLQQAGSSTVLPIAVAWAEEMAARGVQVAPQGGGSSRGASALCAGEVDIGDMSRPMKPSEIGTCRANGIEPLAWKVAYDGLTVVVSRDNAFVDHLTVGELGRIWRADEPARTWQDVRAGWPAEPIRLYGPDSDSGTYEYFNEVVLGQTCGADGKSQCPIRTDYTPSPDDNVLVEGVASSPHAIGHFGFAYYIENEGRLRAVPVAADASSEPVAPTFATIADGSYAPLSRPVYMVTNGAPEPGTPLHAYFEYAMNAGQDIIRTTGYVGLDAQTLAQQRAWL